ncbi:SsrA-binding protein [Pedobacter caeni]|uniref:SsrA-binding protein n=2 Tax=Sphingobacteriaceae TaxID=84566 RepID=A0A1M5G9L6_9SPHI|nr:SsrA-binding protein [Pedobacter caeni]
MSDKIQKSLFLSDISAILIKPELNSGLIIALNPSADELIKAETTTLQMKNDIQIKNKRAYFDYHIVEEFNAGLALLGTEIKAIRQGKANMSDAFCMFIGEVLYVRNLHISEYSHSSFHHHDIKRDRILLLHKKELKKLKAKSEEKGYTIVPLRIYTNERGFAKIQIALAQGKKEFDKRDSIKDRESKREMDRAMKF